MIKIKAAKKAPDALTILWRDKFFVEEKSQKEVEGELHKRGYNFGDATRKALSSADFLLPQGKWGEKKFIQKYPFNDNDEKNGKRKRSK